MTVTTDDLSLVASDLFVPAERWGWEYVPPAARPYPHDEPVERPPAGEQDIRKLRELLPPRRRRALKALLPVAVVGFVAWLSIQVVASLAPQWAWLPLAVAAVAVVGLVTVRAGPYGLSVLLIRRHRTRCRQATAAHELAHARWLTDWALWTDAEASRVAAADAWFPVELDEARRVDVFGGTPEGWAGMLVTMGAAALARGSDIVVVDLSEDEVADPLAELARARGLPVGAWRLPGDLDRVRLLSGLDSEQVAEIVSSAVQGLRPDNPEGRLLHADLVEAVAGRLAGAGEVTLERLRAGLQVLRGSYDPRIAASPLSPGEVQELAAHVDVLGTSPRAQDELHFLLGALETLTRRRSDDAAGAGGEGAPDPELPLGSPGLTILASVDANHSRRRLVDGLLVQSLMHHLGQHRRAATAGRPAEGRRPLLVLAGLGDHVTHTTVELLTKRARRAGVRLVLMVEHLRGDLQHLLGSGGSASVIMQLGNAQEALAAAEFVGREHTFVVSQVTRQSNESTGHQESLQGGWGWQRSEAGADRAEMLWYGLAPWSRGALTSGFTGETPTSYNESAGWTRGATREQSRSVSQTEAREYRFSVEPTAIQALAPMSYLCVTSSGGRRRVLAGSCDPLMVGLDRIAPSADRRPGEASPRLPAGQGEEPHAALTGGLTVGSGATPETSPALTTADADSAGQRATGQNATGQDRTGQDRTGQDARVSGLPDRLLRALLRVGEEPQARQHAPMP